MDRKGLTGTTRTFSLLLISAFFVFIILNFFVSAHDIDTPYCTVTGSYSVCSDQLNYLPDSTAHISGSGFDKRADLTIKVTRPDSSVVTGDGSFAPWPTAYDRVTTDGRGKFQYDYILNGILGQYLVEVLDANSNVLATHTFLDAPIPVDFRQCANKDPTLGSCHWINSILQQSNSKYFEGMSTLQRIVLIDIPSTAGNVHYLTFRHQAAKGSAAAHAYDFLTSWDQAVAAADTIAPGQGLLSTLNACGPEIGPPGTLGATCASLRAGSNTLTATVPDAMGTVLGDNVATRVAAYEAVFGDRTIKIYGSAPINSASLAFDGYSGGSDPDAQYTITWTSASDKILIEFAGHLSVGADPLNAGIGYGAGKGSGSISGGPYHFSLDLLDDKSLGNQDNQIKAADILFPPPPKANLTVIKHVINDNGGNAIASDFTLHVKFSNGTDVLGSPAAGSESGVSYILTNGTYVVSEDTPPSGYTQVSITGDCSPNGTVVLNPGDSKTCTITNDDKPAKITLIKNVINDNNGIAGPNDFGISIDSVVVLSGSTTEVDSNTIHTIDEAGLFGYTFVSITGDPECPSVLSGTVTLNEGQEITCTITNDDIQPKLIVIKHVINTFNGIAVTSDFTIHVTGNSPSPADFAGEESPGTMVAINAGFYNVSEDPIANYVPTFSTNCSATIAVGETRTCTITNTEICEDEDDPHTMKTYGVPFFTDGTSEWINTSTPITLDATDNDSKCPSGVNKTFWRNTLVIDEACRDFEVCQSLEGEGDWNVYTSPFNKEEESCHLIEFFSVDNVNKTENVNKQCVFVDNTPPEPNKTVGEPREVWDGSDAQFYNLSDICWQDINGNVFECWKVTPLTPITLDCTDPEPHPVDHEIIAFNVELDGDDMTVVYCERFGGVMGDDGFCHVDQSPLTIYFGEESEHNLEFYCVDALGNRGPIDEEKFKVGGDTFKINLNKKWNLISVPFSLFNTSPAVVFEDVSDIIISVWTYDGVQWFVYTPDNIENDNLDEIVPGWGYWILTDDEGMFNVSGSLFSPIITPPSKPIVSGWNLVGYYGNEDEEGNKIFVYDGPDGEGKRAICALGSLVDTTLGLPKWNSLFTYWEPFNPSAWVTLDYLDRMDPGAGYWLEIDVEELYSYSTTCPLVFI